MEEQRGAGVSVLPSISVVLAAYNVEKYLPKCMDSLLCQTLRDIEIVAVDDGSADGTGRMLDEYAAADARVTVIHQPNAGVSAARNAGIARAAGEYVAFVDGDDWAEPDMCEHALRLAGETGADLLMCGSYFSYPDREARISMFAGDTRLFRGPQIADIQHLIVDSELAGPGFVSNATFVWAKLWRRETLMYTAGGWFTEGLAWGEDQLFNLNCLEHVRLAAYTGRALYHYRVSHESVTRAFRQDRLMMYGRYLDELGRFVAGKGAQDKLAGAYRKRVVFTLILAVRMHFLNPGYRAPLMRKAAELKALMRSEPYASALAEASPDDFKSGRGMFVTMAKRGAALPLLLLSSLKGVVSGKG